MDDEQTKDETSENLSRAVARMIDRYRWSLCNLLFATLTLFAVLLFFEDLPSEWHSLVAALICYVLILAFVAGFEIRLIAFSDTKRKVAGKGPKGLPAWGLYVSWGVQILNLIWFVVYIVFRGLL